MQNANGFCVNISERDLECYIRFWEYSNGVGNFPDWSIIIVRSNFKKNQRDEYGYYQTLGLRLIKKDFFGHNYALELKDLNV